MKELETFKNSRSSREIQTWKQTVTGNERVKRRLNERKREKGGEDKEKERRRKRKKGYGKKGKEVAALCGRSPTSSKHERANNGQRPMYPPLFGPCEEACGHVSSRVPGDRIKRGWQKGSRRCT